MRVLVMFMPTAKVVCAVLACLLIGIGATFITAWVADHGQPLYFPTTGVLEGYNGDWPHPMPRNNRGLPGLGASARGNDGVGTPMGFGPVRNDDGRPTHLSRAHEWNRDRLLYTLASPDANVMQIITRRDGGMDCILSGVPFRALTRWSSPEDDGPFPVARPVPSGAFKVGKIGSGWLGGGGVWGGWTLPVHPIWPGFAYNAAINSVAAWALGWMMWQGPRVVRGRRRRSKGLCVRCGYDRRGIGEGVACPECGGIPGAAR